LANQPVLFFILVSAWFILLMYLLVSTTEEYFCAAISRFTERLKLSNNLVGVTFLAVGNSAPEIFTTLLAIRAFSHWDEWQDGDSSATDHVIGTGAYVAVGTVIGSSMICSTLLLAVLTLFGNSAKYQTPNTSFLPGMPEVTRHPAMRDVAMFLLSIVVTVALLTAVDMPLVWKGVIMVALFVVYLAIVLVARHVAQTQKAKRRQYLGILDTADESLFDAPNAEMNDYGIDDILFLANRHQQQHPLVLSLNADPQFEGARDCHSRMRGTWDRLVATVAWGDKTLGERVVFCLTLPAELARRVTIPPLSEVRWSKIQAVLSLTGGPLFLLWALESFAEEIDVGLNLKFPYWSIVLVIGAVLSTIVFFTSRDFRTPSYFMALVVFGFAVASVWLYVLVRELLGVVVLSIETIESERISEASDGYPSALWGLHLLAWATGLQDIIANVLLASLALPSMAVAAAFAAPTMALLIGLGITCIVEGVKHYPARHLVMLDNALLVGFALLFLSGLVSLVWVPLAARIPAKTFAAAQLLLYVLFVIGTVLVEFRYVLPNPIFALQ
jgi:sodium/potassium/calcium exchanger 6